MERRLAAILAADIVGYTKLMGVDEMGTLKRVKELFGNIVQPAVEARGGRIVKLMGDGVLAEFPSVVEAVHCAVGIQKTVNSAMPAAPQQQAIQLRIGVNLGDIILEDGDIFGDGVNVASRLEAVANPGGICISRSARDQIRDKLDLELEDLGQVSVKNVARPVRVFRISTDPKGTDKVVQTWRRLYVRSISIALATVILVASGGAGYWYFARDKSFDAASISRMAVPLPTRPSVAVLPFRDLSDNETERYFSDGITEDIIADLSKVSGILVVAHGSTQNYRDEDVSFRLVSEDLGVKYVLTGSIRRLDSQLRVAVQLVDAIKGEYIWGETYDRKIEDVFVVQSEIAQQVARGMSVTLKASEHDRLFQKQATNIEAYDAFLKARATVDAPTPQNIVDGEVLFRQAIDLDPNFAAAYAGLSFNYSVKARFGFTDKPKEAARLSLEYARKAIHLDANQAWSYIGLAGAFLANAQQEDAVDAVKTALALQPNGYEANLFTGFYLNFAGRSEEAVKYLEIANELSRIDTIRGLDFLAMAYFTNKQYDKCEAIWLKRFEVFGVPNYPHAHVILAAAQALQNKMDDADATVQRFQRLIPNFRIAGWPWINNYLKAEDRRRLYDGAVVAGVAE